MTVCVGVLCANGAAVIGASDKMISTADNQTRMQKIHHLTDEVVVMIAGDVALHAELLIELRALIAANAGNPELFTVKNLADSYALAYGQAKLRRAERKYLLPIGLDAKSFLSDKSGVSEKLAGDLVKELVYYPMPDCAALFMGIDSSSGYLRAHLYTVERGEITCCNEAGFAAIGVGVYQAHSSLMFSGHTAGSDLDTALYLTFAAKKRAEVAPGVGVETDMVYVSNTDTKYIIFGDHVTTALEKIYAEAEKAHKRANATAERKCHEYLQTLRAIPSVQQPNPTVELSGTPPSEGAAEAKSGAGHEQPAAAGGVQQAPGGDRR